MTAGTQGYSLAVELTPHCNQKCDYCYNAWRDDNGAELRQPATDVLLRRIEKFLDAVPVERVTLTGGEPFSRHDLFEVLDLLQDRSVPVQMISNGGVVTEQLASRLGRYALHFVQITLNGPDAALHEEHVGPGHFPKTLAGIQLLRTHRVPVVGCVVVTRKNAHHLGATLALWASLGVEHVALSRFSPAGYAVGQIASLLPSRSDLVAALDQALPFARDRGFQLSVTMPIPPCMIDLDAYAPIRFGFCPVGTPLQEFVLGPDGRLRNCTLHGTPLASLDLLDASVDVRELLRSPVVSRYRDQLPAFCEGCLHASSCGGGCGAASVWALGDRSKPDPVLWQHVDDDFEAHLQRLRSDGKRRLVTLAG
ncbi:MAG: radical SAM protein [Polyangiaceae bacterium]|jgi:radical SAM protein with 4Fe4S-binding SPASM domain|nr:radical SAM protein [Polyangiaceae bacterium]